MDVSKGFLHLYVTAQNMNEVLFDLPQSDFMIYLVIAAGFAPSSFLLAKLTFCKGYQLISLMFTLSVHVPPFFSCFTSKFCVITKTQFLCALI